MAYMWILWLILAVGFAVIEMTNASFFVIWFSVGSLAALVVSLFIPNLAVQLFVFLIVSIPLLLFTRKIAKKFFQPKHSFKTNMDTFKNAQGIVTQEIDNSNGTGQIKVNGEIWSAISASGEVIPVDTRIIVFDVKGVKLIVDKDVHLT